MNSLTELNNFSRVGVAFQDDRPPTFVWSDETPDHQYITSLESLTFTSPTATTLTQIYSAVDYLSMTVDVSALPGTTVSWPAAPVTLPVTGNVSTGIYTISGLNKKADWTYLQNPVITMGPNPPNLWNYTTTITYNSGNTKSWITSVSVVQVEQLTTPSDFYYSSGSSQIILHTPSVFSLNIANTEPSSYSCNVSASDNTVFGNLSAPGSTFIGNVLTMTGNLSVINQKLGNIAFWPADNVESTWVASYELYNPLTHYETKVTQTISSLTAIYLSQPTAFYYDEDLTTHVINTPLVTDVTAPNTTTYTLTVTSVEGNSIQTLSSTGIGGNSTFNGTSKTLTIIGTKAQINSHLGNLYYTPPTDFVSNFNMRYSLTAPGGNVSVRTQPSLKSALNTTISNMNLSRSYVGNTADQLVFPSNVPQIIENVVGATYTIQLSTTAGKFGLTSSSVFADYTYTGTKAQCNAVLSTIKFYPIKDVVGNQSFIYTQLRNSVLQTSQTVSYVGTARTLPYSGAGTYTYTTTQAITLSYEQANYLRSDVLVIGGGASTHYQHNINNQARGSGGGGGGGVTFASNLILGSTNLSVTIGTGGALPVVTGTEPGSGYSIGNGNKGNTTSLLYNNNTNTLSAPGGEVVQALISNTWNYRGGTSGNLQIGVNGTPVPGQAMGADWYSPYPGLIYSEVAGGGGSVNGIGYVAYMRSEQNNSGGAGKEGYRSNIDGTWKFYAGGGGGSTGPFSNLNYQPGADNAGFGRTYGTGGNGGSTHPMAATAAGVNGALFIKFYPDNAPLVKGDSYLGGIYLGTSNVSGTNYQYIGYQPTHIASDAWNLSTGTTYATNNYNDGYANTSALSTSYGVNALCANDAWNLVYGGQTDWFIPSAGELTALMDGYSDFFFDSSVGSYVTSSISSNAIYFKTLGSPAYTQSIANSNVMVALRLYVRRVAV